MYSRSEPDLHYVRLISPEKVGLHFAAVRQISGRAAGHDKADLGARDALENENYLIRRLAFGINLRFGAQPMAERDAMRTALFLPDQIASKTDFFFAGHCPTPNTPTCATLFVRASATVDTESTQLKRTSICGDVSIE